MVRLDILSIFDLVAQEVSREKEIFDMITYTIIAFSIPFFFKRPQELIFIITNVFIILAALNLKWKYIIPVLLAPSVGAFAGAYVFGDFTFVITYFIPIIWIADIILISLFKWLHLSRNLNFFITLFIGSTIKYLILALSAYAFILNGLAPRVFMLGFGKIQLITAFSGGVIAYLISYFRKNK